MLRFALKYRYKHGGILRFLPAEHHSVHGGGAAESRGKYARVRRRRGRHQLMRQLLQIVFRRSAAAMQSKLNTTFDLSIA